ncbi:DUF881 domain-containing protein [Bacilliculturomica massiliensis]|uniref:DUF881 domain-containing protein n=1 Tax=Bacilliculturomica massiliensis TaxID=1917867 RepID=UPI00102F3C96|nr:DUF881 domain-containing protein [Bacilliculturomica massiliensis]
MKKFGGLIMIGILALIIGLIISVQISSIQGSDQGGLVPSVKVKAYEQELQKLRAQNESQTQQLIELEDRLENMMNDKAAEDESLKQIYDEREKYKLAAGLVEVKGPGIVITLEDPEPEDKYSETYSSLMYNYELLLSLVNRLKDAGAEAISINGERIVSSTEISLAGDNVNINTRPTAPPYVVKAIGDPDTLEGTITIRFGIIEKMKSDPYNIRVDIARRDDVVIPRYSGTYNFRYAKPNEENAEGADASAED